IISTPGDVMECTRARVAMPWSPADTFQMADAPGARVGSLREVLQKVEETYIRQVLQECDGQVCKAAKKLGIHRSALWRKIQDAKSIQQ
ncbi:MAG TPA: helix-turn-helix domain-containing protein, partial [Negativicutes bacterium]|nr:helix-turn-helix domain-containing protein [Negativicutes bacterium]